MKTDNQNLTEIFKTPKRWHQIPRVSNWTVGWTNICQKPQLKSIWPGVNWRAQARAWHEHRYITACVGGQRWLEIWGQASAPSCSVSHGRPGAYRRERGDLGALPAKGMLNVSLTPVTSASIAHFLTGRSIVARQWLIRQTRSDLKDFKGFKFLFCHFLISISSVT